MTRAACQFVGPLTFEAITGRPRDHQPVRSAGANTDIEHIALASSIDLLLVAPATANIIGKFAGGLADDFLSSLYLATRAPVLVAPAMNTNMWEHEAVPDNLAAARGAGRAASWSRARGSWPAGGWARAGWPSRRRSWRPSSGCCGPRAR